MVFLALKCLSPRARSMCPLAPALGLGTPENQARILDTGTGRWMTPQIEGRSPAARSDTCMAYDSKGSRLFVFGGWSSEWHGDMYTLDVGNIVGPPRRARHFRVRRGHALICRVI